MSQWLALYLSWQYPWSYRVPDRLSFLAKLKQKDPSNFSDIIVATVNTKDDFEFYNSLLNLYEKYHSEEEFKILLDELNIPLNVRKEPYEESATYWTIITADKFDIWKLTEHLEILNEKDFSRTIVMPILHELGYEEVEYKWVTSWWESDNWTDFKVVKFYSPSGIAYYVWVQCKSVVITSWDSKSSEKSKSMSVLNVLINEINTAFHNVHLLSTGEEVRISEMLIFNSKAVRPSALEKLFEDDRVNDRKIKVYDCEKVTSLLYELDFRKDFLH